MADIYSDNIKLNDREREEGLCLLKSKPRRLIVTLSTRCNVRCIMCNVRDLDWHMPYGAVEQIKELFPYLGSVAWQGGEVFFLDYFKDLFIEAAGYKHIKQTIVTNGLLLDDEWIDILSSADTEIAISIDSPVKEEYEKIREGADFDKLKANIEKLITARAKKKSPMTLRLHSVIMKTNYRRMAELIEFAAKYGFDAVHFMPLYGEAASELDVFGSSSDYEKNDVASELCRAVEITRKYGIKFLNSLPVVQKNTESGSGENQKEKETDERSGEEKNKMLCYLPWQQLNIDPGGEVRAGCICPGSVGSVLDTPIIGIWNSARMQELRKRVLARKTEGICSAECNAGTVPWDLREV